MCVVNIIVSIIMIAILSIMEHLINPVINFIKKTRKDRSE